MPSGLRFEKYSTEDRPTDMKRNLRLRVSLLVVLACVAGGGLWRVLTPREPAYQGQRLNEWADHFSPGNSHEAWLQGTLALRGMGTNALPFLVQMLDASDSRFQLKFMEWIQSQRLIKVRLRPAHVRRASARNALASLGGAAKPAVPLLVQMAGARDKDVRVRAGALNVLMRLGREANEAVPGLIEVLQAKADDMEIKSGVCGVLAAIGPEARPAVPALIAALKEKGPGRMIVNGIWAGGNEMPEADSVTAAVSLFAPAAGALGRIGPGAKEAVPALLQALDNEDREIRESARKALKRIDPTAVPSAETSAPEMHLFNPQSPWSKADEKRLAGSAPTLERGRSDTKKRS